MRRILLWMAESPTWKRLLTGLGVTRRVVARFVPGETLDDAAEAVRILNGSGMSATLNPLGENVSDEKDAAAAAEAYIEIIERIAADGLDSTISVKLTMLGLDLGRDVAVDNLVRVLEAAAKHDTFVRIDMEASAYVDATLAIFRELRSRFPRLGVVIQSYLRRSAEDIEALVHEGAPIRVVKGAYAEPAEVAFPDKSDVDRSFHEILDRLARPDAAEANVRVAVATHDPALVAHGRELVDANSLGDRWEFQMLYGIGRDLQQQLVVDGYAVRVYVSYGTSWYPWFMRRLAERPANVGFFLRHLFG